jgi:uncharacterized membrane protein YedE/YeeE
MEPLARQDPPVSGSASSLSTLVAWCGFGLAFVFGVAANRVNFCTMGAVSDVVNMGHWSRMRMWLLAIAVAIMGTYALQLLGQIDLSRSFYVRPNFTWLSYLVGGFLFGVGMTLGSGCGSKTLVRIGGGSLKALVVLAFLGVAAYMTLKGLFAVWRMSALDPVTVDLSAHGIAQQDLPTLLAALAGVDLRAAQVAVAGLVSLALLAFIFKDREFRANGEQVAAGVVIGLTIVGGWYVTGHLGYGENPETLENVFFGTNSRTIESLSFTAPAGYLLELLMLWSDKSLAVTFGVAAALGIIAGSTAYALASRTFRWEGFISAEDTGNHIVGGILMGFGGVTALGCTIGQGISGFSTLAIGSILSFAAIVAGAALTMKFQYWRMMREA